jgi:hypothetical protein
MNDEDIAFFHLNPILHHLAGVHVVIAAGIAQVNDRCFMRKEIKIKRGNILARCVEMDLTVQVGSQVIGVLAPLGAIRLKYLSCNGSYVGQGGVAIPSGMVKSIIFIILSPFLNKLL